MSDEHTYENFKKEMWFPQIINRQRYEAWEKEGSTTMGERLNVKVKSILEEHTPDPIPEKMAQEIHKIAIENI